MAAAYQPSSARPMASPRVLVQKGMQAFQEGKVLESIQYFDEADSMVPNNKLTPYLWQRGISLYYNEDFLHASRQFQYDVQVNPNDVEEMVWNIASLNRLKQQQQRNTNDNPHNDDLSQQISRGISSLPKQVNDRRPIMKVIYSLFRGTDQTTEKDLAMYSTNTQNPYDEFYSLFYLGLYCESIHSDKDDDDGAISSSSSNKAAYYMRAALQTSYAQTSTDYMVACAKVHCHLRHWL